MQDPNYKKWRKRVFARDRYTCKFPGCGKKGGRLNAHHIKRWADNPTLRYEVTNGITLCHSCHGRVFGREKDFELQFITSIANPEVSSDAELKVLFKYL